MKDKLALVTGASSGIGYWLAKDLGRRGYDLVVCSAGERLDAAAADFKTLGVDVTEVSADLATREGVDAFWKSVIDLGRPVDVACINAGIGVGGLFAETELKTESKMVELNCVGVVHLVKHVVKHMLQLNAGKILITSSIAGEMVASREAVYAATKAFDLSFAHSLRYELRDTSVSVTALQPVPLTRISFIGPAWTIRKPELRVNTKASPKMSLDRVSTPYSTPRIMFTQHLSKPRWKVCWRMPCPARSRVRCTKRWPSPLARNEFARQRVQTHHHNRLARSIWLFPLFRSPKQTRCRHKAELHLC
jgi:short-subunit dehydrogenase